MSDKKCYGLCNECKASDVKSLKEEILKIDENAVFDVKCQSNCGPGMFEPFVRYNDKFYIGFDNEEVIEQLQEDLEFESN